MRTTKANKSKALVEIIFVIGAYFLIRQTLAYFEFAPFGSIVGAGNAAIIAVVLGYLLYLKKTGRPFSEIGLKKPASWLRFVLVTVGTVITVAVVANALGPLLNDWFPPSESNRFNELEGNLVATILTILFMAWFAAAFCEEVMFRGIILTRLSDIFENGNVGFGLAIILQAVLFGAMHAYQGMAGVMMAITIGLIFGISVALGTRSLWPVIIVHAIPDTMTLISSFQA